MSIRTVLGDIESSDLGVTYMHEHLIIDSPIVERDFQHIYLPSVDEGSAEASLCYGAGVRSMVDCMPMGSGRDIRKLAQISKRSKINVIAATGLHSAKYYLSDDSIESMSTEELAMCFISEIMNGAEESEHKAGIIKVVSSGEKMNDRENRLFEAAAIAHSVTGAPILTHCEHGVGALSQIKKLQELGVDLTFVVMSHTDKVDDLGYHIDILQSGICVEYDQALRQIGHAKPASARLTYEVINRGFINQVMFGSDGARRSLWITLGGTPGLAALYEKWSVTLLELGITRENIETMFISNPAKFLSMKAQK